MFDTLSDKFTEAFKNLQGKGRITESNIQEALEKVRTALLEADVNFKVVKSFISEVKTKALGEKVLKGVRPQEQFVKIIQDELAKVMGTANEEINLERPGPIPILVVGLNGQGKTTFSGKLALRLSKKKKNVLLVPADTFRPAAKDQLQTLAGQIQVDCFDSDLKTKPKEIVLKALEEAQKQRKDVVVIDTAGRLHVDNELMQELIEVRSVLADKNPEVLLVADAMTGQEAVNVAKTFHEAIGLSGVVLSKMDSDARGGAALSIRYVSKVPIHYISVGEKMKDLELFHPDRLAGRILDMGDIVSLVEKVEEEVDQQEQEKMLKNLEQGRFSVEDFMKQMKTLKNLGSLSGVLKMLPGAGGFLKQMGDLTPAQNEMRRMEVMIGSMTRQERRDYKIIKESRIQRIALGSGQTIQRVKEFLDRFREMEKMMGGLLPALKNGAMPGIGGIPGQRGGPFAGQKKRKKRTGARGPWGRRHF